MTTFLTVQILFWLGAGMVDDRIEQVRCAEIGFSQAAERKDAVAFAEFVDHEARFASGDPVRGREAVVASWQGFLTPGGADIIWRPAVIEVLPSADLALSRGPYRVTRTSENGETSENWGHFISTWRRSPDGRWRVVFDSGGDAGMIPSDAEQALLAAPQDCPD